MVIMSPASTASLIRRVSNFCPFMKHALMTSSPQCGTAPGFRVVVSRSFVHYGMS
jgi:hypothetical protein